MQGWPGVMYNLMLTYGFISTFFYFSALILVCYFLLLQMVLAVITDSFNKQ